MTQILFIFAAIICAMVGYHTKLDLREYAAYMSDKNKRVSKALVWGSFILAGVSIALCFYFSLSK